MDRRDFTKLAIAAPLLGVLPLEAKPEPLQAIWLPKYNEERAHSNVLGEYDKIVTNRFLVWRLYLGEEPIAIICCYQYHHTDKCFVEDKVKILGALAEFYRVVEDLSVGDCMELLERVCAWKLKGQKPKVGLYEFHKMNNRNTLLWETLLRSGKPLRSRS